MPLIVLGPHSSTPGADQLYSWEDFLHCCCYITRLPASHRISSFCYFWMWMSGCRSSQMVHSGCVSSTLWGHILTYGNQEGRGLCAAGKQVSPASFSTTSLGNGSAYSLSRYISQQIDLAALTSRVMRHFTLFFISSLAHFPYLSLSRLSFLVCGDFLTRLR